MVPEVDYQVITAAPVDEIVALYQAAGWWQESRQNRDRIPSAIRGSFCFMVARLPEGKIIGMGRVISDGASDAYIQDVVVLPRYRGHGIGRELIRRLTNHCLQNGLEWIGLVAEPGTADFYRCLGYGILEGYQPMLHGKRG
jgi:ribosomal protein S18 acetylase RimI-like enzyme